MSIFGDIWDWGTTAVSRVGSGIASAATGVWNAGSSVLSTGWTGVKAVFGDDESQTKVAAAWKDVKIGAAAAWNATLWAGGKVRDGGAWVLSKIPEIPGAMLQYGKYILHDPWDALVKQPTQGLSNAVVGTVGMAADLGVGAFRMAANLGLAEDKQYKKREKYLAETWKVNTQLFADPIDPDYKFAGCQRFARYALGQAPGEILVFIGVTAVTGGTASGAYAAAWSTARGGAMVASKIGAVRVLAATGHAIAEAAPVLGKIGNTFGRAASWGVNTIKTERGVFEAFAKGFKGTGSAVSPVGFRSTVAADYVKHAGEKAAKAVASATKASKTTQAAQAAVTGAEEVTAQAARLKALSENSLKIVEKFDGAAAQTARLAKKSDEVLDVTVKIEKAALDMAKNGQTTAESAKLLTTAEKSLAHASKMADKALVHDWIPALKGPWTATFEVAGGVASASLNTYMDVKKGEMDKKVIEQIEKEKNKNTKKLLDDLDKLERKLFPGESSSKSGASGFKSNFMFHADGSGTNYNATAPAGGHFNTGNLGEQFWTATSDTQIQEQGTQQNVPRQGYFTWTP